MGKAAWMDGYSTVRRVFKLLLLQPRFDLVRSHYRQTAKTSLARPQENRQKCKNFFLQGQVHTDTSQKKNSRHAARDKDLSELRQKRYRKTNPTGLVYERTGQLAWSGEGREWEGVGGIIELQWPYGSTIGEVMCWINSVPDLVFDRAVPSWPPPPRSEAAAAVTHLSEPGLLPARTVIQTDSQSLWLMEHYF